MYELIVVAAAVAMSAILVMVKRKHDAKENLPELVRIPVRIDKDPYHRK